MSTTELSVSKNELRIAKLRHRGVQALVSLGLALLARLLYSYPVLLIYAPYLIFVYGVYACERDLTKQRSCQELAQQKIDRLTV